MKNHFSLKAILIIVCLSFIACKDNSPKFIIEGTVVNADSSNLYLEMKALDKTILLDSAKLDSKGQFKFSHNVTNYPEFYYLRLNKQVINLVIDSVEHLEIQADAQNFGTDYKIDGSTASNEVKILTLAYYQLLHDVKKLNENIGKEKLSRIEYLEALGGYITGYKETAVRIMSKNFKSPAAYYPLFQKLGDLMIFDPSDKKDINYFRAVSTSWSQAYPESPRSKHLEKYTLRAIAEDRVRARNEELLVEKLTNTVSEDYSFDISLTDQHGNKKSLSELKGKIVLLDFTAYQTDFSPSHNIHINAINEKASKDFVIYQVSFDNSVHAWKNTADNLPWTCVRLTEGNRNRILEKYNIQELPSSFLINKKGEIVKRIEPNDNLLVEISKLR